MSNIFKTTELQIIAQVRKHPELYDTRQFKREQAAHKILWKQIGIVVGLSAESVKRRWILLRNHYFHIRRTSLNPNQDYKFFNYMRFLDEVYPNVIPAEKKQAALPKSQNIEVVQHLEPVPRHIQTRFAKNNDPPIITIEDDTKDSEEIERDKKDDCDVFGELVASGLRSLQSDAEREVMKREILQVIINGGGATEDSNDIDADGFNIVFIE